jgi:uncharacterized protein (DUF2147 family)
MKLHITFSLAVLTMLVLYTNGNTGEPAVEHDSSRKVNNSVSDDCDSTRILCLWLSPDEKAKVRFEKNGDTYSGRVVWVSDSVKNEQLRKSDQNVDPEHQNGPEIFTGFRCKGGKWVDGTIYVAQRDKRMKCKLRISDDGQQMYVTVSKGIFSRTKTFTRIEE